MKKVASRLLRCTMNSAYRDFPDLTQGRGTPILKFSSLTQLCCFQFPIFSVDRRPIDPPPIVQLKLSDCEDENSMINRLHSLSPHLFLAAILVPADDPSTPEDALPQIDFHSRMTIGRTVSSLYLLRDLDDAEGAFFVFSDISVRADGLYRMRMCLFEIEDSNVCFRLSVTTDTFTVYSAKKFPGMYRSCPLTRHFAEQGLKIRIRNESKGRSERRRISRPTSNNDDNDSTSDDDRLNESQTVSAESSSDHSPTVITNWNYPVFNNHETAHRQERLPLRFNINATQNHGANDRDARSGDHAAFIGHHHTDDQLRRARRLSLADLLNYPTSSNEATFTITAAATTSSANAKLKGKQHLTAMSISAVSSAAPTRAAAAAAAAAVLDEDHKQWILPPIAQHSNIDEDEDCQMMESDASSHTLQHPTMTASMPHTLAMGGTSIHHNQQQQSLSMQVVAAEHIPPSVPPPPPPTPPTSSSSIAVAAAAAVVETTTTATSFVPGEARPDRPEIILHAKKPSGESHETVALPSLREQLRHLGIPPGNNNNDH
ncbi:velvet factor-domain-containing protein [Syncephalastrum racemosum]|uniref:Velvet factor-domain-containing protein n=1 Tax=Syncephalastrum racemosum TaxID=13706 RepID=A0A1X2H7A1_SYNRA|nr:velvet factor-domain-containing protein [Syncephalastrum racemosum]